MSVGEARHATISRTIIDLFHDAYLQIEREREEQDSPTVQELKITPDWLRTLVEA